MESNLQSISAFQIYNLGTKERISVMVDHLWLKDNCVFFRIVEGVLPNNKQFKKEQGTDIYSINIENLLSIRCRLYF